MHLRRLNLVDEMAPSPEKVKSADHDSPPNLFSELKAAEGTATVAASSDGGNARSNGGQSGVVVAIAVCFILLSLMLVCKNRARRESLHSGERSIHHRGNKKKVAPLPMPPVEPQVAAIANGGDDNIENTNNADAVDDEEQPQVHEEPRAREEDDTEVDNIANNGNLTAIPE
mmetsp:Transcript_34545/g.74924  ORF Transcript_34545/g.74924 Transcript_34545/m.74924 type:complete len:172 (+) Transcript_34545:251-766(+)